MGFIILARPEPLLPSHSIELPISRLRAAQTRDRALRVENLRRAREYTSVVRTERFVPRVHPCRAAIPFLYTIPEFARPPPWPALSIVDLLLTRCRASDLCRERRRSDCVFLSAYSNRRESSDR